MQIESTIFYFTFFVLLLSLLGFWGLNIKNTTTDRGPIHFMKGKYRSKRGVMRVGVEVNANISQLTENETIQKLRESIWTLFYKAFYRFYRLYVMEHFLLLLNTHLNIHVLGWGIIRV